MWQKTDDPVDRRYRDLDRHTSILHTTGLVHIQVSSFSLRIQPMVQAARRASRQHGAGGGELVRAQVFQKPTINKKKKFNDKFLTIFFEYAKCRATQHYNLGRRSVKFCMSCNLASNHVLMCLYAGRTSFSTFVQYLIAFCSWPEAASDVISGMFVRLAVPDTRVNFIDTWLNNSPEIELKP